MTKRRRLFFDIEVSPNIAFIWEAGYKKNIDAGSIIKERAIICICYKWEDEKDTHSLQWDHKQNDKKMLEAFVKVANTADEMIGHNGDKFDLAWIRTRCLFHGIGMFPKYSTIDTLKVARSKFKFNSNKLNYIADFLGIGQKIKTDFSLWKNIVLEKDPKAMEAMIKYCKKDVVLLEKVYKHLAIHIEPKTHYGVIFGTEKVNCPECGSDDIWKQGSKALASGARRFIFQCKTCHRYFQRNKE